MARSRTRDESRIANYFWVSSQLAGMTTNQRQKELAQYASDEQPIHQFKHENCLLSTYGLRKMQVDSKLNPPLFDHTESAKPPIVERNGAMLGQWLAQRRTDLIRMNRDNAIFESGTIRLRGNEAIKAGMFLQIQRGDMVSEYYVHRVEHDFVPFQGFFTTVAVDRGTGFIDRAQETDAPFYRSMNSRGVS